MWNAVGEQDAAEWNEVEPERCKQGVQRSVDLTEEPPLPGQFGRVHINELWSNFWSTLRHFPFSLIHSLIMLLL